MERWVGKVAIVTGASSGIGAGIARRLVEEGLLVVGLARRFDRLEQLSQHLKGQTGKLYPFKADITQEEDILKAFEWTTQNLGPVSVLVNNAGLARDTTLMDGHTTDWKTVLDTNFLGLCICTREAVRSMRDHDIDGQIIHIGSLLGLSVLPFPRTNVYPASKFAITASTEVLRQELNSIGSGIKHVCPGAVNTEITDTNNIPIDLKNIPLLQPEDVAGCVAYILSTPPHVQVNELVVKPVGETLELGPVLLSNAKETASDL